MSIPEHRRMAAGRTWPSMYRAESFDPISHYHRTERRATLVITLLCVAVLVGIVFGVI